jgi:hypothetical protein
MFYCQLIFFYTQLSPTKTNTMKKLHLLFTIFPMLILFYNGNGQPSTEWTATYNGPGGKYDKPRAMFIDADNNTYITGPSEATRGNIDYATVKYDANGQQKWVARYNGEGGGEDWPYAITVDGTGNVYVTGRSMSGGKKGNFNYATVKYNQLGQQQWVAIYNSTLSDIAQDVKVDGQGNVYVTGSTKGPNAFDGYAMTTIKYSSVGNQVSQVWAVDYDVAPNDGNGSNQEAGNSLVLDVSGNVYVAGKSGNKGVTIKYDNNNGAQLWVYQVIGGDERKVKMDGDGNILVTGFSGNTTKLDAAGNLMWQASYPGAGFWDLALDGSGNIYVAGETSVNGHSQYKTVKYNSAGVEQWASNYYGDANSPNFARRIAVGLTGNVYVTGYATILSGSSTATKIGTVKYDAAGNEQWVAYTGTGAGGFGIGVDNNDNVYVTGELAKGATDIDFITVKYSQGSSSSKNVITAPLPEVTANFNVKNYPNPFYQNTTIEYQLSSEGKVRLTVYDMLGHEVATLVNETKKAGIHFVNFSANKLSPGIYFYKMQFGEMIETKKLIVLK